MPAFSWTTDVKEAEVQQLNLRELLDRTSVIPPPFDFAVGLAIGTGYDENTKHAFAVAARFDRVGHYYGRRLSAVVEVNFPYVPGLYAFRVGPAVCSLLDDFTEDEDLDLFLIDGQGIAHPRGFGLAAHIGVLYNKPTVGATRNNLYGTYVDPPTGKGNRSPITDPRTGLQIGCALSLGSRANMCYVSPGHGFTIDDAADLVTRISGADTDFPRVLKFVHRHANINARSYWAREKSKLNL